MLSDQSPSNQIKKTKLSCCNLVTFLAQNSLTYSSKSYIEQGENKLPCCGLRALLQSLISSKWSGCVPFRRKWMHVEKIKHFIHHQMLFFCGTYFTPNEQFGMEIIFYCFCKPAEMQLLQYWSAVNQVDQKCGKKWEIMSFKLIAHRILFNNH